MKMAKLAAILWVLVVLGGLPAQADLISIKLTSDALGLGSSDINSGNVVDPDVPGLITSPTVGKGSILTIQKSGQAGPGTVSDPLLVTLTAQTHLDVTGLPTTPHDYQAGILYISDEDSTPLDGAKEGLGVKAFTVDNSSLIREIDGGTGRAKIEGSKHISGGTDTHYVSGGIIYDKDYKANANGAPHEDESVTFDFDPFWLVDATSVEVLLSEFKPVEDIFDLDIELTLGSITETSMSTTHSAIVDLDSADNLWKLSFSEIRGVDPGDLVQSFTIRADLNNAGKKSHFWITGMNADIEPVPVPPAVILGVIGLGFSGWLGRRKFSV